MSIGDQRVELRTDRLVLQPVEPSIDAGNVASRRVLEKLGFHFVRRGVADGVDTLFYALVAHCRIKVGEGSADR